jgi:hypothetical protein
MAKIANTDGFGCYGSTLFQNLDKSDLLRRYNNSTCKRNVYFTNFKKLFQIANVMAILDILYFRGHYDASLYSPKPP